jgi:DNA-binding transcriptional MocR family regulator
VAGRSSREIAASVERGIREGALATEEQLPTIRELARELQVSPATVAAAYRRLRERGLVLASGRRGTVVSPRPPLATPPVVTAPLNVRDLRLGFPDQQLLPDLAPILASVRPSEPQDRRGRRNDEELLELASRRFATDGLDNSHLAVVGGALDGIERVLATHLDRGDLVAVEDPCYPPVLDLLAAMAAHPVPIAVDEEGPRPDALAAALARRPSAFVVVPRAQNPTGAALSHSRAAELRNVLQQHAQLLVVEDDHAHDIAGVPSETLTDGHGGPWAVIRSVSKSLNPDLRLAVISGDEITINRLEGRQALGTGWVSTILQRIVAMLWSDRSTDVIISRARDTYAERREALIAALRERGIEANGRTGLNVWVPVRDEAATVEALLASGWAVHAGERFRLQSGPGIRVTISTLQPEEAPVLARAVVATQRARAAQPRSY